MRPLVLLTGAEVAKVASDEKNFHQVLSERSENLQPEKLNRRIKSAENHVSVAYKSNDFPPKKHFMEELNQCLQESSNGGCSQSPQMIGTPITPPKLNISEANANVVEKTDMSTGKCACASNRRKASDLSGICSADELTASQAEVLLLGATCGRKTPELKAHNSNTAKHRTEEIMTPTGMLYGKPQRTGTSKLFLRKYEWQIIGVSEQLRPTLVAQLEWSEAVFCSRAELVQESLAELGTKPVWTLTLRYSKLTIGPED
jgi:hypothetical protein